MAADSRSGIGAAQPPPKHPATAEFRVIRAIGLTGTSRPFRWLLIALLVVALGLLSIAAFPLRALPDGPVAVMLLQRRAQLAIAGVWLLAVVAMVIAFT